MSGWKEDVGGHVQSSFNFERICCLAARITSSVNLDVTGFLVGLGWRSDTWLEREGVSWLPLEVFSVVSVVGQVEDKEGR